MRQQPIYETDHARRAGQLTTTFEAATSKCFAGLRVTITDAAEPSTGGGVRALQHIALHTPDGRSLVVGWANVAAKAAELSTLGLALATSKQRFGTELEIPSAEYLGFLEAATQILQGMGLHVDIAAYARPADQAVAPSPAAPHEPRKSRHLAIYVSIVGCMFVLGAAVAWFFLRG